MRFSAARVWWERMTLENRKGNYPAFREGRGRLCRRLERVEKGKLFFTNETKPRGLTESAREKVSDLRPGDWLGLTFDSKGRIRSIELLAPCLTDFKSTRVPLETLRE